MNCNPGVCLDELNKTTKGWMMTADFRVSIWICAVPNTKRDCCTLRREFRSKGEAITQALRKYKCSIKLIWSYYFHLKCRDNLNAFHPLISGIHILFLIRLYLSYTLYILGIRWPPLCLFSLQNCLTDFGRYRYMSLNEFNFGHVSSIIISSEVIKTSIRYNNVSKLYMRYYIDTACIYIT
jgi:hypothetical protein